MTRQQLLTALDARQATCPHGMAGWHERCVVCAVDVATESCRCGTREYPHFDPACTQHAYLAGPCGRCAEHCGPGCPCGCHTTEAR